MKTLFFTFFVLIGAVQADDLKSSIGGLESAKSLDVSGNVWDGTSKAISFGTEDAVKIQKIIKWLRAIPTRADGRTLGGDPHKVSAREALTLDLTFADKSHHILLIIGRLGIVLDNDRMFRADDIINLQPLLEILPDDSPKNK